jgi:ABC-type amino acid transport substrate-binding protein
MKTRSFQWRVVGAIVLSACTGVSAADPLKVRFAPEQDYGPFVYLDKSGQIRGLSVDILQTISLAAQVQVETLPARPLSDILAAVRRGEVDLVSSLRPTPERAAFLAFSRPYVSVPAVLVVGAGATGRQSLADLSGQAVAVGKGYAVEPFVREKFPNVRWVAVPDDTSALRLVLSKKVRAAVADIASVGFVVREEKLQGLQVHGPIGFEYELSFAYPKERSDIGQALELGLRAVNPGDRSAVTQRWLDADALGFRDHRAGLLRWIAIAAMGLAAVLLAFGLMRRRSR